MCLDFFYWSYITVEKGDRHLWDLFDLKLKVMSLCTMYVYVNKCLAKKEYTVYLLMHGLYNIWNMSLFDVITMLYALFHNVPPSSSIFFYVLCFNKIRRKEKKEK